MDEVSNSVLPQFNLQNLISDVIDFGILAADDFVIIERPYNHNHAHPPPIQNQPFYYMSPVVLPVFVPQFIYYPVYHQCNYFTPWPQQYFQTPPIWHQPVRRSTIEIEEITVASETPNERAVQPSSEEQNLHDAASDADTSQPIAESNVSSASASEVSIQAEDEKKGENKTPYQGNRRSVGRFLCQNCRRTWQSVNTWANMWQICFRCLERVYPNWQVAQNSVSRFDFPTCFMESAMVLFIDKQHPQEYCGMCKTLGQNCRLLDSINCK